MRIVLPAMVTDVSAGGLCCASSGAAEQCCNNSEPAKRDHRVTSKNAGYQQAAGVVCVRLLDSIRAADNPQTAANESHRPGTARLPVTWIRYVQIAGVKPPKIAVARL